MLKKIKSDGSNLVPLICKGISEIKQSDIGQSALHREDVQNDVNSKLDIFFLSRIGIRMLIGQHVDSLNRVGGRVELLNPEIVAQEAVNRAHNLCLKQFNESPCVHITYNNCSDSQFTYVRSHLHHMIFELVKNSMRATMEQNYSEKNVVEPELKHINNVMDSKSRLLGFILPTEINEGISIYPPKSFTSIDSTIKIIISQGTEDLTIKVSDQAGGICRSNWEKLWHYTYSTFSQISGSNEINNTTFRDQFSGGGYGLPIARLFARYFGGELTVVSMEGYGTDAYIQVHRLGKHFEVVPGATGHVVKPLLY